jgi:hypothetical protein
MSFFSRTDGNSDAGKMMMEVVGISRRDLEYNDGVITFAELCKRVRYTRHITKGL